MIRQNHVPGARWRNLTLPLLLSILTVLFLLYCSAALSPAGVSSPAHTSSTTTGWPAQGYQAYVAFESEGPALQSTGHISGQIGAVEPLCACKLDIKNISPPQTVSPGDSARYELKITNQSDCAGTLTLSATSRQGWQVRFSPATPLALAAHGATTVTAIHTAPTCESDGVVDVATVRAALDCAACGRAAEKKVSLTTTVSGSGDVALTPPHSAMAVAGETVLFSHTLTNPRKQADVFRLEAASTLGWAVTLPDSVSVGACGSAAVQVSIVVPPAAQKGQVDSLTVTATSTNDPGISAQVVNQVEVLKSGCEIDLRIAQPSQAAAPTQSVVYTLTLQNIGVYSCTADVKADVPPGWSSDVTPPAMTTLPPTESADWLLRLTVPPYEPAANKTTGVTAILDCANVGTTFTSSKNIETTVLSTPVAAIEPDIVETVMVTQDILNNGALIAFTHTVTNVGNLADTFDFSVHSNRGWTVTTPASDQWAVGEARLVAFDVTVPPLTWIVSDTLSITASPRQAPQYADTARDRIGDGRIFLPITAKKACEGRALCNGNLETGGLSCWNHGGELPVQIAPAPSGGYRALLGDPYSFGCRGGVPIGRAWLSQSFKVPSYGHPILTFDYQMYTQHSADYDTFEVYLKVKGEEYLILKTGHEGVKTGCSDNPAVISGACTIDLTQPTDCDGTPLPLAVDDLSCAEVTLRFENWNRSHMWYNTWTYLDNVQLTW